MNVGSYDMEMMLVVVVLDDVMLVLFFGEWWLVFINYLYFLMGENKKIKVDYDLVLL